MISESHHGYWQRPASYFPGESEFMEVSSDRMIVEIPHCPDDPTKRAIMPYWIYPDDPSKESYSSSLAPEGKRNRFTLSTKQSELVIAMGDRSWAFTKIAHDELPEPTQRRFREAHEKMDSKETT